MLQRRAVEFSHLRARWLPFWKTPSLVALVGIDVPSVTYSHPATLVDCVIGHVQHSQGGLHTYRGAAWKPVGGDLVERKLHFIRPVPPPQGNGTADFPTLSIQRFEVLLSDNRDRAIVRRVLPAPPPDPELAAVQDELSRPVTVDAGPVGILTLDRRFDQFKGEATWNGRSVAVSVEYQNRSLEDLLAAIDDLTAVLTTIWQQQESWERRLRRFIQHDFETENEEWLEETEISAERLASDIQLVEISLFQPDHIGFLFNDSLDVLGGHALDIGACPIDGPLEMNVVG